MRATHNPVENSVEAFQAKLQHPYRNWRAPFLPSGGTLALCETEAEVVHVIERRVMDKATLIALTPQAAAMCHLLGHPYVKIEDFFDVRVFRDVDEAMLSWQSRWSDSIDTWAWEAIPPFGAARFRPAGHYFFFLKILSDMLFRAAFGLAHLFLSAQPRQVVHFAGRDGRVNETLFFAGSAYPHVLPACASVFDVETLALPKLPGTADFRSQIRAVLPSWMVFGLRRLRGLGTPNPSRAGNRDGQAKAVVFSNRPEVGLVMRRAYEEGIQGLQISDAAKPLTGGNAPADELGSLLRDLWPQLRAESFFGASFRWMGADLLGAAESRLRYWWLKIVSRTWRAFRGARARFAACRPGAVMVDSPITPEEHGVIHAARSFGVPTVTYQHGGFEGNCEYITYDMTDLRQSDYRLVYGSGIAEYLRERKARCNEPRAEIIPVGSARLDSCASLFATESASGRLRTKIRQQLNVSNSETLVVYLPTSYQYNWYMARQSFLGVPYFELVASVMEILRGFTHLRFVYKPFPELPLDPLASLIKKSCSNVSFIKDLAVLELLAASDAFIIDMPSTGMLEAMLTDKPILVHSDNRFISLRPEARELLRRRVTLTETPKEFLEELRFFLSRGRFSELKSVDRSFLRAYGTHLDDGQSAHRAVAALRQIMQEGLRRG